MRKVMVSEYKWLPDNSHLVQEKGIATFHQFGVDFEELKEGTGNYTIAVVEWPDGTISSVPVNLVRFLDHDGT